LFVDVVLEDVVSQYSDIKPGRSRMLMRGYTVGRSETTCVIV